ncbi:MAG: IS66 family insertion sequence element accessory protein TnpB [Verrucomicrobiales bacterium]|nr:IS66 family insertion sequence element accessory protein TnpB [Verrucomicrobiales bacterium]
MSGALFVFRSRRGTALKMIVYDGQGYWLAQNGSRPGASTGGRRPQAKPAWNSTPIRSICSSGTGILPSPRRPDVAAVVRS